MPKNTKTKNTWNLTPLFKSDTDPAITREQAAIAKRIAAFVKKWQNRTDYLNDPKILRQALDEYEQFASAGGAGGRAGYYFELRLTQNGDDPILRARAKKIEAVAQKIGNDMQFFPIRVSKIAKDKQAKLLAASELAPYRHFLSRLFEEAAYVLSEPEEKIMNLKGGPAHSDWTSMRSRLLNKETAEILGEDGKKKIAPMAEIYSLMASPKKKVRDIAAKEVNRILAKHSDVAEAELNAIFENKKIDDELRGFDRPDASRHLADDVSAEMVDALTAAVASHYDISQRYYRLKARLFKTKQLAYHESGVPYGGSEKGYSYEEAIKLVGKVMNQLDPEFKNILDRFVKNGQFDVYPRAGKTGGAFCAGEEGKDAPTYILLNHTNKLWDTRTIAHELGHGINNELSKPVQNALNFGVSTATAEVASTFMEDFVLEELAKNADDKTKLVLLMAKLGDDIGSIFRQVAGYRFEQELHQTFRELGYLPKETIGKIFLKHMGGHMGPAVRQDPGVENRWVYWSHIRLFFYVYSYSSGQLISKSLQAKVRQDKKFIAKVKDFLAAGVSDSPKNIFAKLGVDIEDKKFWLAGLQEVAKTLEEAEKLAAKILKQKK